MFCDSWGFVLVFPFGLPRFFGGAAMSCVVSSVGFRVVLWSIWSGRVSGQRNLLFRKNVDPFIAIVYDRPFLRTSTIVALRPIVLLSYVVQ